VRCLQLPAKPGLARGERSDREAAVLKVPGEQGAVLKVLSRLALGVQQPLDSLDDLVAVGQEQRKQLDMFPKWNLTGTCAVHNAAPP
jgi:hypothetical protein